ncbi:hypothetical protein ES703_117976 [subsurface metagenome]
MRHPQISGSGISPEDAGIIGVVRSQPDNSGAASRSTVYSLPLPGIAAGGDRALPQAQVNTIVAAHEYCKTIWSGHAIIKQNQSSRPDIYKSCLVEANTGIGGHREGAPSIRCCTGAGPGIAGSNIDRAVRGDNNLGAGFG